ncbi:MULTISPECIES: hypothetical protein [Vibrio]|uniref:hypothetical protein n=1 Tax=Vibrio TaxID=662 RepID=UPI000471F79D|nr:MULTISPECIES: hypothetical protein [Vibrio]EKY4211178.1 hypothetical protein [Vibrio alginolyticus]ELA7817843.1 hypothetical protein [Vibrio alginolyticus]ELB2881827.1 hypothetical protein [Vibrio alginolyticus]MBS9831083.1 hypothetical protein [Vibrio alginolyticus]MDA0097849.1 hypothetical protein [Vibrio sp. ART SEL2]
MNKRILNGLFFVGSFTLVGCTATDSMPTETKQPAPKINSVSAEVISSWIDSKVLAPEGLSLEQDNLRYLSGSADLNSDGKAEYIVLLQDRYFCGSGGCAAYMFDNEGNVINQMSVTRTPIVLADSYSNGWQDFIVWSNGSYRLMSYNGESYPSNPSLEPKVDRDANQQAAIANVMATELYQQDGYDILPAESKTLWTPANVYHFTFKHYGDPHSAYQATVDMSSGEVDIVAVPAAE